LTVGIGIAAVSRETTTLEELVKNVNAALSKAKLQGKNHLCLDEEVHEPEQTEKARS